VRKAFAALLIALACVALQASTQGPSPSANGSPVPDRLGLAVGNHFTVSFEGPKQSDLAERALESLDRAYWRVGDALNSYPADPVPVVLYTTEEFRDITRAPGWAAGAYDGTIRIPMRGALNQQAELDRVLAHEFAHALIRSLAPRNVPTWLNEGIAAALERESLAWALDRVQAAGGPAPLAALTRSFGSLNGLQAELAYATSALAARTLLDVNGGVAMSNLLRDLGHGEPLASAFEHRMNEPLDRFSDRFRSTY